MDTVGMFHEVEDRRKFEDLVYEMVALIKKCQDSEFEHSIRRLLTYTPEYRPPQFTLEGNPYYNKGSTEEQKALAQEALDRDNQAPFFSEAYLYNLLGKEDARTLLALMRPIWMAAGLQRGDQP